MKAIITGSSKGLGFALANQLASEGHAVTITSRDSASLEKAMNKITESHPGAEVIGKVVDFGNLDSIEEFANYVLNKWGDVDILINNVGMFQMDRVADMEEADLNKILQVNFNSAVRLGRFIIPELQKKRSGFIINILSVAARSPRPESASYSISKVALKAYTDLLRKEMKKDRIKVVGIYPGAMDTSSWDEDDPVREKLIQMDDMKMLISDILKTSGNAVVEEISIDQLEDL